MRTTIITQLIRTCACLFVLGLYGCSACPALAQRNPVYMSIEADVVQSKSVYVGTVSKVGALERDKDGYDGATITIDATETLKGSPRKRLDVFAFGDKTVDPFRTWNLKRTPLLWFIRPKSAGEAPTAPNKYWSSFPIDPAASISPLPAVGYFSMEFRLIRSPRQILAIARRYARTSPSTATLHSLRYMPDLVHRLFPYNTDGELLVPIGPELEKVARHMILSPGAFLPSEREVKDISHDDYLASKAADEGVIRRMGVEALAHFKSSANIDLLKRELDDPFLESSWDSDPNVYSVRKLAFNALKQWGVQVTEPPLHPASLD